jgi:hypothetical protein
MVVTEKLKGDRFPRGEVPPKRSGFAYKKRRCARGLPPGVLPGSPREAGGRRKSSVIGPDYYRSRARRGNGRS